jgi:hypothetical protein
MMSNIICRRCGISLTDEWKEPCPQCGDIRHIVPVSCDPVIAGSSVTTTKLWITASFSKAWFDDALHAAQEGQSRDNKRKEIVFAVCFTESYLYEFVRDHILKGQYDKLIKFFPVDDRRGIRERWKEVLRKLNGENLIKAISDFGADPSWQPFIELVNYRDGLIHAKASRTVKPVQNDDEKPIPSPQDLQNLESGWAVKTVVELVRSLHRHADIPPPTWLVEP